MPASGRSETIAVGFPDRNQRRRSEWLEFRPKLPAFRGEYQERSCIIICSEDAKHQGGVLCTENKVLRAKYDGPASVAKYLGRLPLLILTKI